MKNIVNIGLLVLGGYLLWEVVRKGRTPKNIQEKPSVRGNGKPAVSPNALINGKKKLMTESQCAERAKLVRFGSDQEKYEWIVACMQTYSGAHGNCASCDGDNTRWVAVP